MHYGVLVVFCFGEGVVGVSQDAVFGVVFHPDVLHCLAGQQGIVLLGQVGLSHRPALSLVVAMHPLLKPVGDECA